MRKNVILLSAMLIVAMSLIQLGKTNACTRVVYKDSLGTVMYTARSMDWKESLGTKLWYFPANIEHKGSKHLKNYSWTSKYSSVVASAYNISSSDGMNNQGLVANLLWLSESEYLKRSVRKDKLPGMPISILVQYVLDMYASVDELVADGLGKDKFEVFTSHYPNSDGLATLHLSVSDKSGNSAIIEFIDGETVIYQSPDYLVMTNSPPFKSQIPNYYEWKYTKSADNLPGSNLSPDRFARAAYYTNNIKLDQSNALAGIISIIRDCSVPVGVQDPVKPNISTTIWRTIADSKNGIYYFESAYGQNILNIDFNLIKSLGISKCGMYDPKAAIFDQNDITSKLFEKEVEPFVFLGY